MKRNVCSLFLALALCLSMLPAPARAADPERVIIPSAEALARLLNELSDPSGMTETAKADGDTVTLLAPAYADRVLQISCDLTLEFNSNSLNLATGCIQVDSGRRVVLQDTTYHHGVLLSENPVAAIIAMRGSELTVRDIQINANSQAGSGYGILAAPTPRDGALKTVLSLEETTICCDAGGIYVHSDINQAADMQEGNYPVLTLDSVAVHGQSEGSAGLRLAGMAETTITGDFTYISGSAGIRISSGILRIGNKDAARPVQIWGAGSSDVPDPVPEKPPCDYSALLIENLPGCAGNVQVTIDSGTSLSSDSSYAIGELTADGWAGTPPEITINGGSFSSSPQASPIRVEQARLAASLQAWESLPSEIPALSARGRDEASGIDYPEIYAQAGLTLSEVHEEELWSGYSELLSILSVDALKLERAAEDDQIYQALADPDNSSRLLFGLELKAPDRIRDKAVRALTPYGNDLMEETLSASGGLLCYAEVYNHGGSLCFDDSFTTLWLDDQDLVLAVTALRLHVRPLPIFLVSFDSHGGSQAEPVQVSENTALPRPANPTRTGYLFNGWYRESFCKTPWDFEADTVMADLTLHAKWKAGYTVSFDSQGGSAVAPQAVAPGGKASRPADPVRRGYSFDDWYLDQSCKTPYSFDTYTVNQDVTLYAGWTALPPAAVTFNPNGGTVSPSSAQTQDGKLSSLPTPTREGYTFEGWFTAASGGTAVTADTEFSADTTIYAHWKAVPSQPLPQKYKVTFSSQGGSAVKEQQVTEGGKVKKPSDPTRSGYRFDGWYQESACKNLWNFDVYTVEKDTVLYAGWTASGTSDPGTASYQVTFDSQGGSAVPAQTVASGGKASRPADPARSGWQFGGWYLDSACKTPWDFGQNTVTQNLTLYAKWTQPGQTDPGGEEEEYSIRVRSGLRYGEIYLSHRYAQPGQRVTITAEPDSDARLSWLDAESSDGQLLRLSRSGSRYTFTMPAANVTVDAGFTLLSGYSGSASASQSQEPVKTAPKPSFPALAYRPAASFQDISWDSWAYSAAQWAYQNGFLDAAADGSFQLNGPVSHLEMWRIMARWQGAYPSGQEETAAWARQSGASKGTPPGASMTRQDVITYLYKCCFLMGADVSAQGDLTAYRDRHLIKVKSSQEAWLWAVDRGLVSGTADGRLNPYGAVTRTEFAVILMRLCQM